jgi:hypothetical protein
VKLAQLFPLANALDEAAARMNVRRAMHAKPVLVRYEVSLSLLEVIVVNPFCSQKISRVSHWSRARSTIGDGAHRVNRYVHPSTTVVPPKKVR